MTMIMFLGLCSGGGSRLTAQPLEIRESNAANMILPIVTMKSENAMDRPT
jgi:hypothetical protein